MTLTPFWADPKLTYAKRNNIYTVQIDFGTTTTDGIAIEEPAKTLFDKVSGIQYTATSVQLPSFQVGAEVVKNEIGGSQRIVKPQTLDWTPVRITFADFVERKQILSAAGAVAGAVAGAAAGAVAGAVAGAAAGAAAGQQRGSFYTPDASFYQALMHAFYESTGRDPKIYQGARQIDLIRFNEIFKSIIITSYFENGDPIEKWSIKGLWPLGFESPELSYEDDGIRKFSFEVDYESAEYTHYVNGSRNPTKIFEHSPNISKGRTSRKIKVRSGDGEPKPSNGWSVPIRGRE